MFPSSEKLVEEMARAMKRVETTILDASRILDFEGSLRDVEKYGYNVPK